VFCVSFKTFADLQELEFLKWHPVFWHKALLLAYPFCFEDYDKDLLEWFE
jgi:hypothetical protein